MKHVAGWESDGRLLELVGDKGKQQETVGRFMSLSVSKTYYLYLFYLYYLMVDCC